MGIDKQLDHLIEVLYETVLDASRWQEAVRLCGHYTGGVEAHLLTVDKATYNPIASIFAATYFDDKLGVDDANFFFGIDPRRNLLDNAAVNEWKCCHHFFNQNFVDNNEFYQDFFITVGARYAMVAIVDDTSTQQSVIGISRALGQPPFGEAEQRAAQRIGSHLQRVLRLQKHTQTLQVSADLGSRTLDALTLPLFIVDNNAKILQINTCADQFLNRPNPALSYKNGHLLTTDPAIRNPFSNLITAATGYPAIGGGLFFTSPENGQLFVTPLPKASAFAHDWQRPLALVFVIETGQNLSAIKLLGKLYDFSPAELKLAIALLAGKSPEDYAQQAGLTLNTVRTQLKSLFAKTKTHRQAELVALLGRLPPLQD